MTKLMRSKWAGRLRLALLATIGAGSILAYIALAMTLNGQPPYSPFPGAVAVLQPSGQSAGDSVQLLIGSSGDPNINQQHPELEYDVLICGPHPYRGDLVMAGAARLTNVTAELSNPSSGIFYEPVTTAIAATGEASNVGVTDVEAVDQPQLVSFSIAKPLPCPQAGRPISTVLIDDLAVGGSAAAPVEQSWTSPFGWWHGPQVSQTWPLAGTLTWDAVGRGAVSWSFIEAHPAGTWVTPYPENVQVIPREVPDSVVDGIPLSWSIDATASAAAQPATSAIIDPGLGQPLSWSSTTPIAPTARLTDSASLAFLQNLLVVAGVGLGVGGAMLASLAFEMLRPSQANAEVDRTRGKANPGSVTPATQGGSVNHDVRADTS